MKKDKILVSCLSNSWGGLEMVSSELFIEFIDHGYEAIFLCYEGSSIDLRLKEKNLRTATINPKSSFIQKIISIYKIINHFEPSSIIVNRLPSLKYITPALVGKKNIKLTCLSHMLVNYTKKDIFHKLLYSRINKLIVLTEYQRRNHLNYLPIDNSKIEIIPDWISTPKNFKHEKKDLKIFFPKELSSLKTAIMASRLDPQKGQDLAIEALAIAHNNDRPFLLLILGDNTYGERNIKKELHEKVISMGLEKYVTFIGHQENIFPYLKGADFTLVPSYEETFGRIVIESMYVGTPVIGSRSGSIPFIIDENINGLLHNAKDAKDIEEKIASLASNEILKQNLSIKAIEKSKIYNKDLIFEKIKNQVVNSETTELSVEATT
ncbi:MAG: glycosyltransferase family 4 protein [Bdellovibrionaceae bacterium]|nr:glycosyltransferase family 4 protein [Bacteriovoracaceae bacterium]MCK6600027.1 glycosyltransferase family 4 protein [Pseudobdellovibrionaceae bacterium]NUM59752.1 glycosyltransferase family 4 protein [Pseudobdellovibrionaceae bacterium]